MRGQEPDKLWQQKGWSREPRNGREWRMLRAGLPQPKERQEKPFRCRKVPSHRTYKTEYQDGEERRRCATCCRRKQKAWYQRNKDKQKVWCKASRARNKVLPVFEDGYATVSSSWLSTNPVLVAGLLSQGRIIVEIYGEPAYEIHPLEGARK